MFGYYGKIVSQGDFLRRRADLGFVSKWDSWLQNAMSQSRDLLGESWKDAYHNAPIWRFCLGAKVCGPEALIGVMMPSQDRVGRSFPLAVFWRSRQGIAPEALENEPFMQSLEDAALQTLEPGPARDRLNDVLANMPAPQLPNSDDQYNSHWLSTYYAGEDRLDRFRFAGLPEPEKFVDFLQPPREGAEFPAAQPESQAPAEPSGEAPTEPLVSLFADEPPNQPEPDSGEVKPADPADLQLDTAPQEDSGAPVTAPVTGPTEQEVMDRPEAQFLDPETGHSGPSADALSLDLPEAPAPDQDNGAAQDLPEPDDQPETPQSDEDGPSVPDDQEEHLPIANQPLEMPEDGPLFQPPPTVAPDRSSPRESLSFLRDTPPAEDPEKTQPPQPLPVHLPEFDDEKTWPPNPAPPAEPPQALSEQSLEDEFPFLKDVPDTNPLADFFPETGEESTDPAKGAAFDPIGGRALKPKEGPTDV